MIGEELSLLECLHGEKQANPETRTAARFRNTAILLFSPDGVSLRSGSSRPV